MHDSKRDDGARRPAAIKFLGGVLSLTLSAGGCADDSTQDPDASGDAGCDDPGCYTADGPDDGYVDSYYPPETGYPYTDDGLPYTDDGWPYTDDGYPYTDDGWPYTDDGYPYTSTDYTSTFPDTDTHSTITTIDTESTLSTTLDTDTTTTGATDTTTTTGATDTTTGTGTETDTDTDTGGIEVEFPPAGAFGDVDFGVQELDLVGTWSLQWAPDATSFDSVITIDDTGEFIWRETSADCSDDTLATGFLWVEPGQIVMHVETWERQLPFDTLPVMGQEFAPPFRLRMSYALLGPNLGLAAPERLTQAAPYTGRAYLQTAAQGLFLAGGWLGEAELIAALDGQPTAQVIVRERFAATLDPEPGNVPESTGVVLHDQIYWAVDPPEKALEVFEGGNWTCLDGCPQPAGATLINGGNLYAYGPYAAFQRMMTFASGRSFRRDVDTDCP